MEKQKLVSRDAYMTGGACGIGLDGGNRGDDGLGVLLVKLLGYDSVVLGLRRRRGG
jgi:hypothetical protein